MLTRRTKIGKREGLCCWTALVRAQVMSHALKTNMDMSAGVLAISVPALSRKGPAGLVYRKSS